MLGDYVDLIPEEKREAFKAEIAKAVFVDSVDQAKELVKKNELLRRAFDSEVSIAVKNHDERFKAEALPGLVDEELRKRNPAKDPRDQKLEEFELKFKALEREKNREAQKARALQKNAELGLPSDIISFAIGENDADTDAGLEKLLGVLKPWQENAVKQAMEKLGSQPAPAGGSAGSPGAITRESLATPEGRKAMMEAAKGKPGPMMVQD